MTSKDIDFTELKIHANVNWEVDSPLRMACGRGHIELEVKKLFEIRKLTKGLYTELDENKSNKIKAKI